MDIQPVFYQSEETGNGFLAMGIHQKLNEKITLVVGQPNLVGGQVAKATQLVEGNKIVVHNRISYKHGSHGAPRAGFVLRNPFHEPERRQHTG